MADDKKMINVVPSSTHTVVIALEVVLNNLFHLLHQVILELLVKETNTRNTTVIRLPVMEAEGVPQNIVRAIRMWLS